MFALQSNTGLLLLVLALAGVALILLGFIWGCFQLQRVYPEANLEVEFDKFRVKLSGRAPPTPACED